MAFKRPNYKTYDTSNGYGNSSEWKRSFHERMAGEKVLTDADNPYSILGVTKNSTQDEIKKAYRKLMVQWHPDKHNNSEEAELMSKKINEAYSKLKKKVKQ